MRYWLMKSEPSQFSIDHLKQRQREHWDGVRNYQARNMMRDSMQCGDLAFFYHSNCIEPGIVGIMEIVTPAYADFTAFDPSHTHYDPQSTPDKPRWFMVDVGYVRHLSSVMSLQTLKQYHQLADFTLLKRGNRLSIMPVTTEQWQFILGLE